MAKRENIDKLLRQWPYDPEKVSVRVQQGEDGRDVLQMRVDMGLLQLETTGRPDGERPEEVETYYDYLLSLALQEGEDFVMDEEQCQEADREFAQFYHRRICWLTLRNYRRAAQDADHSLHLMDFCRDHSPDENWTLSHEQYRPFVLFHRTQAAALAAREESDAVTAVREIDDGLARLHDLFIEHEVEDQFEEDELVQRLHDLRDALEDQYDEGAKLRKELGAAIKEERYELAAEIRDKLARMEMKS